MTPELRALATLAVPLCGVLLILLCRRWPNVREAMTIIAAGTLFGLVVSLVPTVTGGGEPVFVELARPVPEVALNLRIEPLGMLFALIASFLWIVTSIYAIGYMRGHHERNQTRFFVFFALAFTGVMGVAFAGNLLTLFVFYEFLTLSTYPLVTHAGTDAAKRAGRVYLGILLTTSIGLLLFAVMWTWSIAGSLEFVPGGILEGKADPQSLGILLALFVFGIGKAAVMPFHRWLPAAMVAPTPVSALLHAVAVVKAGVFSVVKVSVFVFGLDTLAAIPLREVLCWAAAATIVLASLVAMTRDNLKARLAYSTIGQLSYIVLGALLANPTATIGAGMHIAMHAFGKITLFFGAGAILVGAHKTEVSQLKGIGRKMPWTMAFFLVGSLSIIGLPPFGGMWSKWFLGLGALEDGQPLMLAVFLLSSLLNFVYLLPVSIRAFFSAPDDPADLDGVHEAPLTCRIAMAITAAGCVALFFLPEPIYALLMPIVGGGGS
jgi:multicomponent Na+:H+ antiporter subunit D